MALSDYKVTAAEIAANGVQSQPDKMTGTAAQNKRAFDKLISDIVAAKLNGLIDAIVQELTMKMAAPGSDGSEGQYLQTNGDGTVTWATPSGAGDMLASVYDQDGDGVVDEADHAESADSAESCTGNAATASKLATARTLQIQDADGTNVGEAVLFDGSTGRVLVLPAIIKATLKGVATSAQSCTGNAATATTAAKATTADKTKAALTVLGTSFDGSAAKSIGYGDLDSPIVDKTANYTLTAEDAGKVIRVNSSGAVTITVPYLGSGFECEILRWGSGAVTIAGSGSYKLISPGDSSSAASKTIGERYGVVALKEITSSTCLAVGSV